MEVADLSTTANLRAQGLGRPVPDRGSWAPFQRVGEGLAAAGWAGLIAPSASRPAGLVLCVFWGGPGLGRIRALPRPRRVDEAPVPPGGMTT